MGTRHPRISGDDGDERGAAQAPQPRGLRRSQRYEILYDTAHRLLLSHDPIGFVAELYPKLAEALALEVYFHYRIDGEEKRLRLSSYDGVNAQTARDIEWLELGEAVCGGAAEAREPIFLSDIQNTADPRADVIRSFGITAYTCHPLISRGKLMGTLSFGTRRRASFTDDELALLRTISDLVAVALERAQGEEELHELTASLEERVVQRTEELREVARELTQTESRERRRLAELLHDHLQQLLVAAKLGVHGLRDAAAAAERKAQADYVNSLLDQSIEATRTLAAELYPPVLYQAGLSPALHWLARQLKEKQGLAVSVSADSDAEPALEELRVLLFQGARELLFNVVKHARVPHANVRLEALNGHARLVVEDAGLGFDGPTPPSTGFGLTHLRHRLGLLGGSLTIESTRGKGTRAEILAPRGAPPRAV